MTKAHEPASTVFGGVILFPLDVPLGRLDPCLGLRVLLNPLLSNIEGACR